MKFSFSFGAQDFVSMLVGVWGCVFFCFLFLAGKKLVFCPVSCRSS